MNFTFGIITHDNKYIREMVDSIYRQNIPIFEIIIIGGSELDIYKDANITHIPFDETIKPMWITKKKNLITEHAKYENIVYLHDYIILLDDWYKGFLKYGDDFKICMTKMLTFDDQRYRDWHIGWSPIINTTNEYLIPYDMTHLSKYMYISGAYWVAKKEIMEMYPLNEDLCWGQGEDAEWSNRYRIDNDYSINKHSTVKLLKYNIIVFREATNAIIEKLKKIK